MPFLFENRPRFESSRLKGSKIFEESPRFQESRKKSDGKESRKKMKLIRRDSKKKLLEKLAT